MKIVSNILTYLIVTVILLLLFAIVYFYANPSLKINNFLIHINNFSSLFIVLLTCMYVITTNNQLRSMHKQLNLMDKSVDLQIQPLPIPLITKIYLSSLNAYNSPLTNFKKISIEYFLNIELSLTNIGDGSALNVTINPSVSSNKNEVNYFSLAPEQITHLQTNESSQKFEFVFFNLDNKFLIDLYSEELVLNLKIFYKNFSGAGFVANNSYKLTVADNSKEELHNWGNFYKNEMKQFKQDFEDFEKSSDNIVEANRIVVKVRNSIDSFGLKNIDLSFWTKPESFLVDKVDFIKEVNLVEKQRSIYYSTYFNFTKE